MDFDLYPVVNEKRCVFVVVNMIIKRTFLFNRIIEIIFEANAFAKFVHYIKSLSNIQYKH